jgi:hypothetical protein
MQFNTKLSLTSVDTNCTVTCIGSTIFVQVSGTQEVISVQSRRQPVKPTTPSTKPILTTTLTKVVNDVSIVNYQIINIANAKMIEATEVISTVGGINPGVVTITIDGVVLTGTYSPANVAIFMNALLPTS